MNSNNKCRGVAQFGSALVSGTRGREFESRRPDQIEKAETRMVMRVFLYPGLEKSSPKREKWWSDLKFDLKTTYTTY